MEQDAKVYIGIGSAVLIVLFLGFLFNSDFSGFSGFTTYEEEQIATDSSYANVPEYNVFGEMWGLGIHHEHPSDLLVAGYIYDYDNSSRVFMVDAYYNNTLIGYAFCNDTGEPSGRDGAIDQYTNIGHTCLIRIHDYDQFSALSNFATSNNKSLLADNFYMKATDTETGDEFILPYASYYRYIYLDADTLNSMTDRQMYFINKMLN